MALKSDNINKRFRKLIHRQKRGAAKSKKGRKEAKPATNLGQPSTSGFSSTSGTTISERLPDVRISQTLPNLSPEAEDDNDFVDDELIAENGPALVGEHLMPENDLSFEEEELKLENNLAFVDEHLKPENALAFVNEHVREASGPDFEDELEPENALPHIDWKVNEIIASYKMAIRHGSEGKSNQVLTSWAGLRFLRIGQ